MQSRLGTHQLGERRILETKGLQDILVHFICLQADQRLRRVGDRSPHHHEIGNRSTATPPSSNTGLTMPYQNPRLYSCVTTMQQCVQRTLDKSSVVVLLWQRPWRECETISIVNLYIPFNHAAGFETPPNEHYAAITSPLIPITSPYISRAKLAIQCWPDRWLLFRL